MKNNKKLIAIVAALVIAIGGFIAYLMSDSGEAEQQTKVPTGQLVNFSGADLREEKDGKLIWALSAEKIEYDPKTKAVVLTNMKGTFNQNDVVTQVTAPHGKMTGDRKSIDIDGGIQATNSEGATFTTEALHLDNVKKIWTSQGAFIYKGKDVTITGDKVSANMALQQLKVEGNAKLTKGE
ncbi:MAG: LPS export ABC transporter periplasmic protein LptC [Veillonella sp.]|uniref:LPS export ABC transporter periplasmic protein LptC n=1 Tax=Veillonella sp. TaxID=1926307 RepID=UPI001B65D01D|nr:LPS export ABC transporter periplasmic protein LptC [Veillonella sp.]MBP6923530.1 LPS export ABC transporter periplasmic protein LptC [Veillonella sp.]